MVGQYLNRNTKPMKKEMKIKKLKPHTPWWEREAGKVARNFVSPMKPCRDCGYPVIDGYCCTRCGSSLP